MEDLLNLSFARGPSVLARFFVWATPPARFARLGDGLQPSIKRNLIAMASHLQAMACTLVVMASILIAMASNLLSLESKIIDVYMAPISWVVGLGSFWGGIWLWVKTARLTSSHGSCR